MNDFADRRLPGNAAVPALAQLNLSLADGYSLACQSCWVAQQSLGRTVLPGAENGPQWSGLPSSLSLETIFQAIREALPLGLRQVRLTGGEPLLYPEFDALIDRLESLELSVSIETNGVGITSKRAARLARLPQAGVTIGLVGADAPTQDEITRLPGSFKTAIRSARILADAGLPPQMIFVINRRNSSQMAAAVRLAEELGATSLRFLAGIMLPAAAGLATSGLTVPKLATRPLNGHNGNGNGYKRLPQTSQLTVEELIALGRRMERELIHSTHLRLSFDLPPAFRGLHPLARIEGQGRCEVLNQLSLLPDGEYGLCASGGLSAGGGQSAGDQQVPESGLDLVLGRVGQDPLGKLWREHPTLQTLRASLPDELDGVCERCIMKTACLGNCAVENYLRSGSFSNPHWFCETADRVGLFPASRLIENRW